MVLSTIRLCPRYLLRPEVQRKSQDRIDAAIVRDHFPDLRRAGVGVGTYLSYSFLLVGSLDLGVFVPKYRRVQDIGYVRALICNLWYNVFRSVHTKLLKRDGCCVWTGFPKPVRMHIIPHRRGDEACSHYYCPGICGLPVSSRSWGAKRERVYQRRIGRGIHTAAR